MPLFLSRDAQQVFMQRESDALLQSFRTDRIHILSRFYDKGRVNYWLEGYPQPNERQRQAAGSNFRGTAARCPAQWPDGS